MKKTHYKRILGLFILLFIFLVGSPIATYAKEKEKTLKEICAEIKENIKDSSYFSKRYGIAIDPEKSSPDQIIVKMESNKFPTGLKMSDVVFKVTRVNTFEGFTTKGDIDYGAKDASYSITDTDKINEILGKTKDLTPGGTIKLKRSGNLAKQKGFEVHLTPQFKDPYDNGKCKIKWGVNVYVELESSSEEPTRGVVTITDDGEGSISAKQIDCTTIPLGDWDANASVEYKYCYAKTKAEALQIAEDKKPKSEREATYVFDFGQLTDAKSETISASYKKVGSVEKFKCDKTSIINGQSLINKRLNGEYYANYKDDYYTKSNRSYKFGKARVSKDAGKYYYNYEKKKDSESAKCELECSEAVIVEYGPPVASEAGLCFGYKVKLTSIVSCEQIKEPTKPRDSHWCNPTPECLHPGGGSYLQGGPNEEFDSCISSCDGGKYTDKCVNKCYNRVYGNGNNNISSTQLSYEAVQLKKKDSKKKSATKKTTAPKPKYEDGDWVMDAPKYTFNSNGVLIWDNAKTTDKYSRPINTSRDWNKDLNNYIISTDPLYHRTKHWGVGDISKYTAYHDPTGIPKKANCTDSCYWRKCSGDREYLNEKQANHDAEYNQKVYRELKKSCSAAASCTTTTAEFTIKVNNKGGAVGDAGTIKFPYRSQKDEIKSQGKEESDKKPNVLPNDTTVLGFDGCYKDQNQKRWYQTEWTFPGTWIEDKSKKTQFEPTTEKGYSVYEGLYCLPQGSKSVNRDWWYYYYAHKVETVTSDYVVDRDCSDDPANTKLPRCSYSATNTERYNKTAECKGKNSKCDYSKYKDASTLSEPKWNISAESERFGYFGWSIKIDCFYSSSNITCPNSTDGDGIDCPPGGGEGSTGYRIRTVDLENLFPDKDGSKISTPDTTGRTPGFNWSEYATQTTKDTNYTSNPKAYTKWVQGQGKSIYTDDNIDYQIKLTKDRIKELKREVKKSDFDYTKYNSSKELLIDSVTHYQSDYIRSNADIYPNEKALECNNIKAGSRGARYGVDGDTRNGNRNCQEFE